MAKAKADKAVEAEKSDSKPKIDTAKLQKIAEIMDQLAAIEAKDDFWKFCKYYDPQFFTDEKPHLKLIAEKLQAVADGTIKKLAISVAPRAGKSYIVSLFCGWMLGRNPKGSIMRNSYAATLAEKFSKDIRDGILVSPKYLKVFPNVKLSKKNTAVDAWSISTNSQPSYFCAGVGGAITGLGCRTCLPAGEKIHTDRGTVDIEDIYQASMGIYNKVLTFDPKCGIIRYNKLIAKRKVISNEIREIHTESGRTLRCTPDHRVWNGESYAAAGILQPGDKLYRVEMRQLRENVSASDVRTSKKIKGGRYPHLLLSKMRWCRIFKKEENDSLLHGLWESFIHAWREVLFFGLHENFAEKAICGEPTVAKRAYNEKAVGHRMSYLPSNIQTTQRKHKILFEILRGPGALKRNPGRTESQFSGHQHMAPKDERQIGRSDKGQGRLCVRPMRRHEKATDPSRGREPTKQCGEQPCDSLLDLPHRTPQIVSDTITRIDKIYGEIPVYDIQVAEDSNFFASDFLVHNCAILDDPIKNIEEALSETVVDGLWNWYTSTHLSRLETGCPEIHIATRWSKKDPIGRLTDPDSEFYVPDMEVVVIPALDDEGKSFCELVKTTDEYHELRRITDSFIWEAEYMQHPIEEKGLLFPPTEMKRYGGKLTNPDGIVAYVDTADVGSDFLCMVIGYRYGEKTYVDDVVFSQDGMEVTLPQVLLKLAKHKCRSVTVESNAGGVNFARDLRNKIRERGLACSVLWHPNTKNKETRILTQSAYIKEYFVFRNDYAPGSEYDKFFRQFTGYVKLGKNSHDDAVDACTGLAELVPYQHFPRSSAPNGMNRYNSFEYDAPTQAADLGEITPEYLDFMGG